MKTLLCFAGFSLLGWICLFVGLSKTRRYRAKLAAETARAEGVVVAYEERRESAGRGRMRAAYYPVVRFAADGHEYVSTSAYCFYNPVLEGDRQRPPEGSGVALYYDPKNPFNFHLEQDVNDAGRGLTRLGGYIIALSAVASVAIGIILKW